MAVPTLSETLDRLELLIRAGSPVIYIVSHEESRVLDYLARVFRRIKRTHPRKHFLSWYAFLGLYEYEIPPAKSDYSPEEPWVTQEGIPVDAKRMGHGNREPEDALEQVGKATVGDFPAVGDSLTVFFDIYRELEDGPAGVLVRPLRNAADQLRRQYDRRQSSEEPFKSVVIVGPSAARLAPELERDVIVIEFPLPETDELRLTLERLVETGRLTLPESVAPQERAAVCGPDGTDEDYRSRLFELIAGAGRGLPLDDYRLGLQLFSVRGERLSSRHIEDMLDLKARAISNPALNYTPHVEIELGGLQNVRDWVRLRLGPVTSQDVRRRYHLPPPKGVMLCGVSGGGKSQLAKLIAKEFNLALLRLDVGALFGMYVGESEERTRNALKMAEMLAPIVLWLDEIDKAFSGMGTGDNGVSARVFGHFLTWLAEKQDSVFVVATANNFKSLLDSFPEFGRKGRFDEIFWVDLPSQAARREIFRIYLAPLVQKGYLTLSESEIEGAERQAGTHGTLRGDASRDPLSRFVALLAEPDVSGSMTGAEIEHAIGEALYDAYQRAQAQPTILDANLFTGAVVLKAVQDAQKRALYRPGTNDANSLAELRTEAESKNWIKAEDSGGAQSSGSTPDQTLLSYGRAGFRS